MNCSTQSPTSAMRVFGTTGCRRAHTGILDRLSFQQSMDVDCPQHRPTIRAASDQDDLVDAARYPSRRMPACQRRDRSERRR